MASPLAAQARIPTDEVGREEGRENRRLLIWSLLSLERWCEAFL